MSTKKADSTIIDGHEVTLSHLDKVLYPKPAFTKAQVIDYYIRVSKVLLPHLKDRPLTLKRFPNGIHGAFFYEKDAPAFTPEWVTTAEVPRRDAQAPPIRYLVVNDLATLVWSANLANLELHPFLHTTRDLDQPTSIVFDLDPGEGADVLTCIRVALILRDALKKLKLKSLCKVSGSKGLQLYVPLNSHGVSYAMTQLFAKTLAQLLEQLHEDLVVSRMAKRLRPGKVLIDWSQNSDFKTTVGVYSLRAKSAEPFVSLPFAWKELEAALESGDAASLYVRPAEAITRIQKVGDLFKPVLTLHQKLPAAVLAAEAAPPPRKASKALAVYDAKRDFSKTREPGPVVRRRSQGSRRRFVIQKHAASHLHYDFRLEMHGVLKSWAVPKGPSTEEGVARLAMPTEDHPLDYLEFEGIIPKGQYGGGTVMVWDIGTYDIVDGNYYQGALHVFLSGRKLKGDWQLKREKRNDRDVWKLIKVNGSMRSISSKRDDQSAVSKRSMSEIASAQDAVWNSNR